jgi:glycosidase
VEEGDNPRDTRGTHDVLRNFASTVRRTSPGAFTVGEVWDSLGTVLTYYPDQLDSYFAFALSDALLDAVRTGSAKGLLPPFMRMQEAQPATRWSPFQRNHDQTRTITALGGDPARARLAVELLLTLPGLPFVYYGEEIGMSGDKPDERLRTPMQWSGGRAAGFSTGNVWEPLQRDSLTVNVAAQTNDAASLLNLYRKLIHLRASSAALGTGELVPVTTTSDAVSAYIRRSANDAVLVVANLGSVPISGVTITSDNGVLPVGRYATSDLLGGTPTAALDVSANGALSAYLPIATLAPTQAYVVQLRRTTR